MNTVVLGVTRLLNYHGKYLNKMKILTPISLGELYDKITILRIKTERIQDEEKLVNVKKELDLLKEVADQYPIKPEDSYLAHELYTTNNSLWSVEDNLREMERRKDFGTFFIKSARMVYELNDKRSRIKKEINIKYGSDIIEEKSYKEY
jgi:hypothetical protein